MLIESTAISIYNQSCQFLCKHRESVLEQICTRNLHKITANLTLSFQSSNLMVLCGSSFPNESCFLMKDCFVRVHDFFNSMWFLVSKLIVWLLGIDIFMKCNFSRFTDESFSAAIFKDNFDSEFQHWLHRSFETELTSDPRFNCRVSKNNRLGKYIYNF